MEREALSRQVVEKEPYIGLFLLRLCLPLSRRFRVIHATQRSTTPAGPSVHSIGSHCIRSEPEPAAQRQVEVSHGSPPPAGSKGPELLLPLLLQPKISTLNVW